MILKPLAEEITLSANTSNTVFDSKLCRVHLEGGHGKVTLKYANGDVYGSFTMSQHTVELVEKNPSDTIEADQQILVVPVAYRG